jgi:hypothetical protein
MATQKKLAQELMDCGKALSKAKVEIKKIKRKLIQERDENLKSDLKNKLEQMETIKFANQNVNRIIKIIMDGIAWRNMDYNRPILRIMAENKPSGRIDINDSGFKGLLRLADAIMHSQKSIILINDLTNFIRIGDLTEKIKKNVFIHESKRRGKKLVNIFSIIKDINTNRGVSKQSFRLFKVQTAITHKKIFLDGKKEVNIQDVNIKFKNHLKKVKKIIKKAKHKGFCSATITDHLIITCVDIIKVVELIREKKCTYEDVFQFNSEWNESDFVLPFQNLDFFYKNEDYFIPNMTPYSVFPFPVKYCYELMSGRLLLRARLNITKLCEVFRNEGWEVDLVDIDNFVKKARKSGKIFPEISKMFEHDETILTLKKHSFNLSIPAVLLFRIGMDFMSAETLLDEVESIYEIAIKGKDEMNMINNLGEKKVWN